MISVILIFVLNHVYSQSSTFIYESDTLTYQRVDNALMEKLKKKEPSLYRTLFQTNNYLDGCQRLISDNETPEFVGGYNITAQIKYLGELLNGDCRKYRDDVRFDSYKNEVAFYDACFEVINEKQELVEDRASASLLSEKQRISKDDHGAILPERRKHDSISNLRAAFPHEYGTTFGDVPLLDADLDLFLQSDKYMKLALVDGGTVELDNGYRNTYENKSGQRRLLYVDYTLDGRIIKKLVIHGCFDLVVQFYIDYWPFDLTFADFEKSGEIKRHFITDEIVFTASISEETATITIKKATL